MSDITMDEISIQIEGNSDKAVESLTRLTQILEDLTGSTAKAMSGLKSVNNQINQTSKKTSKSNKESQDTFTKLTGAMLGYTAAFAAVKKVIVDNVINMTEYISSVNRFNATFSQTKEQLKETTEWVNKLSEAWLLDEKAVADSMSRYYNMTKTMGLNIDTSMRMSKNLTMLTYDLASFWNKDTTEVMNQVASAMRGEAEGLAKYGISLNQATLQSTLYANGINRTVSSLNAAEKATVVYYQIMKSTANQHGYYAKTILQPANAIEILKTQFTKLGRAIGSIFLPPLMAIIPYLIAITELITKLAKSIASLFGFDLGEWTSGTTDFGAGLDGIADSASNAGKKIKGMLADFDELHTIDFGNESGGSSGVGGVGFELDASQFEYTDELMNVIDEKLEKARKVIADIKDYLAAIGLIIAGFTVSKGVLDFLDKIDMLGQNVNVFKTALGIGLTIGGLYLTYQGITRLLEGDITPKTILETALGMFGLTGGLMTIASGLGITLALGTAIAITAGISLIIAGLTLQKQGIEEGSLAKQILGSLATGAGAGLMIGFVTGNPIIGIVAGLVVTLGSLLVDSAMTGELQKFVDNFVTSFNEGFENIKTNFSENIINPIVEFVTGIATKVYETAIQPIINFFTPIREAITQIVSAILKNIIDIVTNVVNNIIKIVQKIQEMKNKVVEIIQALWTAFKTYILSPIVEKITAAATFVYEKIISPVIQFFIELWNKFYNNFIQPFREKIAWLHDTFWNLFGDFGQKVVDFIGGAIKGVINGILSVIENRINFFIRMLNGAIDIINGIPGVSITTVQELQLPKLYAEGGFPTAGDLFIANESGPEWVGSMNGRTAVANKDQISTGIEEASYRGMSRALKEYGFSGVVVKNFMDSKEIASKITQINKQNANMYG